MPLPPGAARSCESATGWRFVSRRTKSGALAPTAGAPGELGTFVATKTAKQKNAAMATPMHATTAARIFREARVQRSEAFRLADERIGAVIEKNLRGRELAAQERCLQRCVSELRGGARLKRGTLSDQQLGRRRVASESRHMQQRPAERGAVFEGGGIAQHRFQLRPGTECRGLEDVECRMGQDGLQDLVFCGIHEPLSLVGEQSDDHGAGSVRATRICKRRFASEHRLHDGEVATGDGFQKVGGVFCRERERDDDEHCDECGNSHDEILRCTTYAPCCLRACAARGSVGRVTSGLFTRIGHCVILRRCHRRASSA